MHPLPNRTLLCLTALAALSLPVKAATVNLNGSGLSHISCSTTVTDSPVASLTINGGCFDQGGATITASGMPWSASVTTSLLFGGIGSATGSVNFSGEGLVLGGDGSGFISITYTETIDLSATYYLSGSSVIATAGSLNLNDQNYDRQAPSGVKLAFISSSGFFPFVFGDTIPVGPLYASVAFYGDETNFTANISDTATFDIRDANMNPVSGAYVEAVPEPRSFLLFGVAAAVIPVLKQRFRSSKRGRGNF